MTTIAAMTREVVTYSDPMDSDAIVERRVEPFLDIAIDSRWLDEAVAEILADTSYRGLVPCLLPWHEPMGPAGDAEGQISRERFLPAPGTTAVAPVLMCPDDLDFWCTLVVVEVTNHGPTVCWRRIGLDATDPALLPEGVGDNVRWFDGVVGWSFEAAQYSRCLDAFRSLAW